MLSRKASTSMDESINSSLITELMIDTLKDQLKSTRQRKRYWTYRMRWLVWMSASLSLRGQGNKYFLNPRSIFKSSNHICYIYTLQAPIWIHQNFPQSKKMYNLSKSYQHMKYLMTCALRSSQNMNNGAQRNNSQKGRIAPPNTSSGIWSHMQRFQQRKTYMPEQDYWVEYAEDQQSILHRKRGR